MPHNCGKERSSPTQGSKLGLDSQRGSTTEILYGLRIVLCHIAAPMAAWYHRLNSLLFPLLASSLVVGGVAPSCLVVWYGTPIIRCRDIRDDVRIVI